MIDVTKILLNKEQCLGHTWVTPEVFAYLLTSFEIEYRLNAEKVYKEEYWKVYKEEYWKEREKSRWAGRS